MVEVKIVLAPAHHALTFVSLPNFYFYGCRNQPIVREFLRLPGFRADRIRARDELKFENLPMATAFFPRIEEFKGSSVNPHTIANLLVYSD